MYLVRLKEIRQSVREDEAGNGIMKCRSHRVGRSSDHTLDCLTGVEGHCYIRPRFVALIWIL
jgi:hypothetical protein